MITYAIDVQHHNYDEVDFLYQLTAQGTIDMVYKVLTVTESK